MASAVVLTVAHSALRDSEVVAEFDRELGPDASRTSGCTAQTHGSLGIEQCTWSAPGGTRSAVLIGDSNAGHFSEAFIGVANASGFDAIITNRPGCPFVDLIVVKDRVTNEEYRSFVTQSLHALIDAPPDTVLIASCSTCYIEDSYGELIDPSSGRTYSSPDEKADRWEEGQTAAIEPLDTCCEWKQSRDPACRAQPRIIWRAIEAETSAVEATAAMALDVADFLCPDGSCAAHRDGQWIWREGRHITVGASESLAPQLAPLFSP
jgi:hypothetical protein